MKKVYLDNAATTPLSEEVIDAMVSVLKNNYGNPSSTHSFGQEAKVLLENVRRQAADYLHVSPAEIVFTSCGTSRCRKDHLFAYGAQMCCRNYFGFEEKKKYRSSLSSS